MYTRYMFRNEGNNAQHRQRERERGIDHLLWVASMQNLHMKKKYEIKMKEQKAEDRILHLSLKETS